jgi:hypothetical protein
MKQELETTLVSVKMASTETVPGGRVCTFGKSYSESREIQDEIKTNFCKGKGNDKEAFIL